MKSWKLTLIIFVGIFLASSAAAYFIMKPTPQLKIYQPSDLNPRLVDSSKQGVKEFHRVADFKLLNQLGDTVSQADLKGSVYVADFFFATCPTICPVMSSNISLLQEEFRDEPQVKFISHSVTPELDSVEVLYEYGQRYGVDPEKWLLVTGDKKQIYELARKSYFAVLDSGDGGVQDFIHTENFVLVDKEKRLRGFYDGTDDKEIEQLSKDIRILLKEYEE